VKDIEDKRVKHFVHSLHLLSTHAYSHRRSQQLVAALRPLGIPVVLGGLHCTFRPEETIQDADLICLGEAEETIVDLVCDWPNRNRIAGLWVRDADGTIHRNPRRPLLQALDKLPMPDFSSQRVYFLEGTRIVKDTGRMKATHHHQLGDRTTFVYASDRGCPFACTFAARSRDIGTCVGSFGAIHGVSALVALLAVLEDPGVSHVYDLHDQWQVVAAEVRRLLPRQGAPSGRYSQPDRSRSEATATRTRNRFVAWFRAREADLRRRAVRTHRSSLCRRTGFRPTTCLRR
jgi:hypothetical protein